MTLDLAKHIPARRIVCVSHPGGRYTIQGGVEPTVEMRECALCERTRMKAERKERHRKSTRWQKPGWKGQPMTAEETFRGFKEDE